MENTPSLLKRYFSGVSYFLTIIAVRIVGMPLIAAALPLSHRLFGQDYTGDNGPAAFGVTMLACSLSGFGSAFLYLFTATVAHFIVLKRSIRTRIYVEAGVFLIFVILQLLGGLTLHYS